MNLSTRVEKPVAYQEVWAQMYLDEKTEVFEIRTQLNPELVIPNDQEDEFAPVYYRQEETIGASMLAFLETDFSAFDGQYSLLEQTIMELNNGIHIEDCSTKLEQHAAYWLSQSPLFSIYAARIERMKFLASTNKQIKPQQLKTDMLLLKRWQRIFKRLSDDLFSHPDSASMSSKYFSRQKEVGTDTYPALPLHDVSYGICIKGFHPDCYYNRLIDQLGQRENSPQEPALALFEAQVVDTTDSSAWFCFLLAQYLQHNLRLRQCKYCGEYFPVVGNDNVEYCGRIMENSTKTCREMGSLRLYERRRVENPILKEYKRAYKTHHSKIAGGTMTREAFSAWSLEAREKRDLCVAGKLSQEAFTAWLDSDRQS